MPSGSKWLSNDRLSEKISFNTLKSDKTKSSKIKLNIHNHYKYRNQKEEADNPISMNDLFEKRIFGQHGILDPKDITAFKDSHNVENIKKN